MKYTKTTKTTTLTTTREKETKELGIFGNHTSQVGITKDTL